MKNINEMLETIEARGAYDSWEENLHPRDKNGQFKKKGAGENSGGISIESLSYGEGHKTVDIWSDMRKGTKLNFTDKDSRKWVATKVGGGFWNLLPSNPQNKDESTPNNCTSGDLFSTASKYGYKQESVVSYGIKDIHSLLYQLDSMGYTVKDYPNYSDTSKKGVIVAKNRNNGKTYTFKIEDTPDGGLKARRQAISEETYRNIAEATVLSKARKAGYSQIEAEQTGIDFCGVIDDDDFQFFEKNGKAYAIPIGMPFSEEALIYIGEIDDGNGYSKE